MGLIALILWRMFLLLSFVFAGAIGLQRGRKGLIWAGITILGAALTYAFVSVVLGFLELEGYSKSITFVYTVGVGVAGLALFGWGVTKLRR
jgi:hypothetical protein